MSVAFEYGGRDTEPVEWVRTSVDDPGQLEAVNPDQSGRDSPAAFDLHSDIEAMLITR